jgi:DNA primase small subunit
MGEKGWQSADLVFDLDADHLPNVDPAETSYPEMLEACKQALLRLIDFLTADFGFDDLDVVFSGGRGYHVHVRDERIVELGREERREIVDYLIGEGIDVDTVVEKETVSGVGLKNPTDKWLLDPSGGWSSRVHKRLLALLDELRQLDDPDALARLREYEGIGAKSAETILGAVRNNYEELRQGNVDAGGTGTRKLAKVLCAETVAADHAPIDEPVTTDTNRLIRLPGSLHGGSGLEVQRIDREDLDAFDPLVDPVPETFRGHDITVEVTDGGLAELDGDSFTLEAGNQTVPEHVGVFLMARGRAEKGKE